MPGVVDVDYGESWDEAYVACDVALYEAKTSGRNRLVSRSAGPRRHGGGP